MFIFKTAATGLLLALAVAGANSPALAKHRAPNPGYDAQARAVGEEALIMSGPRAVALRACNEEAASLREYTWGNEQSDRYRACMSERGQME